jgi:cleavage and polyadenylation specificity factor subunit 2
MNHMRERHLDGTVLISGVGGTVFESLARPDLLITDAERANVIGSRRKDRDAALIGIQVSLPILFFFSLIWYLDTITTTLSSRCSLLLPCDASTRVLELLVLLDQHWSFARLKYPICLLSRTGREMLTFVRSMMEWLGGTVSKEDVGEETSGKRSNKRRREDDAEEEAIGAFALRFK